MTKLVRLGSSNVFVVHLLMHIRSQDLHGAVLAQYHFDRMVLHDVAVTHDNTHLVCVGTLTASADGLHPSKCRAEKQIIGTRNCQLYQGDSSEHNPFSVQHGQGRN